VPAMRRVCLLLEVYDSKEFKRNSKSNRLLSGQSIYKISQKFENHLHSLGVLHRKK
jgi:hypothetical protein